MTKVLAAATPFLAAVLLTTLALPIGWHPNVGVSAASCSVSGVVSSDTTWSPAACDPYVVTASVVVPSGATLTIAAGTTVKFDSLKGLLVQGTLVARGTPANPITFTSNQATPAKGDWGNIHFTDSSTDATFDSSGNYVGGSIIQYAVIEYAGSAGTHGAVSVESSSPYIDHDNIRNNSASGLYASASGILVANSTIAGNTISGGGGGIYTKGSATVTDSTITGNTVSGGYGGGIYIDGAATITNNIITDNTGSAGGVLARGNTTISNNTISGNTTSNFCSSCVGGAGISAGQAGQPVTITNNIITNNIGVGIYTEGTATISDNTVSNNLAQGTYGGGIGASGTVTITNNVVSNNRVSGGDGGGVKAVGTVAIANNSIADNTASAGGGIEATGNVSISNNTITGNTAARGGGINAFGGSITGNAITGNTATSANGGGGIYVESGYPAITDNDLYDNVSGSAAIPNDMSNGNAVGSTDVHAMNNYWGTTDATVIASHIWDFIDDSALGVVDYVPFRTLPISPPVTPPWYRTFLPLLLKDSSGW